MKTYELIDELERARAVRNWEVLLDTGGAWLPVEKLRAYELPTGQMVCVLHAGAPRDIVPMELS